VDNFVSREKREKGQMTWACQYENKFLFGRYKDGGNIGKLVLNSKKQGYITITRPSF
jgi:hypothetical protein